jgi:hypothetical protein
MTDQTLTRVEPASPPAAVDRPSAEPTSFEGLVARHLRDLEAISVTQGKWDEYATYLFPDGLAEYHKQAEPWRAMVEKAKQRRLRLPGHVYHKENIRDSRLGEIRWDLSRKITHQALAAIQMIEKAAPRLAESGARPEVLDKVEAAFTYALHLAETSSVPYYGSGNTASSMQANPAHRALLVLASEVQALVTLEMQREALVRALDSRTMSNLAAKTVEDINEARAALSESQEHPVLPPGSSAASSTAASDTPPVLSGGTSILSW